MNNVELDSISGDVDWQEYKYFIAQNGSHSLKWCYEKDAAGLDGSDSVWVDKLSFSAPIAIEDALDDTGGRTFTTPAPLPTGNMPWYGQSSSYNSAI